MNMNKSMEVYSSVFDNALKISNDIKIEKINDDITLVDNIFENYDDLLELVNNLTFWEGWFFLDSRPVLSHILPPGFGCELITKVFDHKFDIFSVDCSVNKNSSRTKKLSPSSNAQIPHFDVNEDLLQELNADKSIDCSIFLMNFNQFDVKTNFWSYKNKMYVEDVSVVDDFRRENGGKEPSERFMNDLSEEYSIKYGPNQGILYSARMFHSPNLECISNNEDRICTRVQYFRKLNHGK